MLDTAVRYKELKSFLPAPFGRVYAGKYFELYHQGKFGLYVKLDGEQKTRCDVDLPIPDFGLPESEWAVMSAVWLMFRALKHGHDVYVGCRGGWGRTGTILAIMVAIRDAGMKTNVTPTEIVRRNYDSLAVETAAQRQYADSFAKRHPLFTRLVRLVYL